MIQSTFEREYGTAKHEGSAYNQTLEECRFRAQERRLLTQFVRDGWKYQGDNSIRELSKIEWYSLMRHYGIPTRMVDFTESPLIALYFALVECDVDHNFAVWCIDSKVLGNVEIQKEINKAIAIDRGIDAMMKFNRSGCYEMNRFRPRNCTGVYYNAISAISANEEFAENILGDEIHIPKLKDVGLEIICFFPIVVEADNRCMFHGVSAAA